MNVKALAWWEEEGLQLLSWVINGEGKWSWCFPCSQSQGCDLHYSSCQHWILNPPSKNRDRTRILMGPGRVRNSWSPNGELLKGLFELGSY